MARDLMVKLETLFLRYRERGDAAALGKVFDRTAPQILRVARFLVADDSQAEDVLQQTFLKAIEHADQFQSGKPLVPWLLGIATNEARRLRRRRPVTDVDTLSDVVDPEPSPAALLAWSELDQEVDRVLSELPDPYNTILRLHICEDLEPRHIAEQLQRSPDTVRSQLRRGLELLRRALPTGAVSATIASSVPSQSLAAIRAVVTATAKAGTKDLVSKSILFSWIGFAAVLVLASSVWFFTGQLLAEVNMPANAVNAKILKTISKDSEPVVAHPDAERTTSVMDSRMEVGEKRGGQENRQQDPKPRTDRSLRVRAVDATGLPVAGATVFCFEERVPRDLESPALVPVTTTDANGLVELRIPRIPTLCVLARKAEIGVSGYRLVFNGDFAPSTVSLDLIFRKKLSLKVEVRDARGQVREGVTVESRAVESTRVLCRSLTQESVTDSKGIAILTVDSGRAHRLHGILEREEGARVTQWLTTAVLTEPSTSPIKLKLQGQYRIHGVVLDDNGIPVAHAPVYLWGNGVGMKVQAGDDGTFECFPTKAGTMNIGSAPEGRTPSSDVKVQIGDPVGDTQRVELRLMKEASMRGRLLRLDGSPIHGALVRAYHLPEGHGDRRCTTSADGSFEIGGLIANGKYSLLCWPDPNLEHCKKRHETKADGSVVLITVEDRFVSPSSVHLKVMDGETNLPAKDYYCSVVTFERGRHVPEPIRVQREDGEITIGGLLAGEQYAIDVFRRDVRFTRGTPFILGANKTRQDTVWIRPECALRGVIRHSKLNRRHISVHVITPHPTQELTLIKLSLNADFQYRVQVAPGDYILRAVSRIDGTVLAERATRLGRAGEDTEFDLSIPYRK